jgi:hypothetical protein
MNDRYDRTSSGNVPTSWMCRLDGASLDDFLLGLSGNRTVEIFTLRLTNQGASFSSWRSGKAIGNLEALQEIDLFFGRTSVLDCAEGPTIVPDWCTLSYLLSFLRHKIKLRFGYYGN